MPTDPLIFASVADVEARLLRSLTDPEKDAAAIVLEAVAGLILEAVDKDEEWGAALVTDAIVPATFRALSIEKARSVLANPSGAMSESRTIGAVSRSVTFAASGVTGAGSDREILLSDDEARRCRRTVYGKNAASASVASDADKLAEGWIERPGMRWID